MTAQTQARTIPASAADKAAPAVANPFKGFAVAAFNAFAKAETAKDDASAAYEEAISKARSDRAAQWHAAVVGFCSALASCPPVTLDSWKAEFAPSILERFKKQNEKTAAVRTSQLRVMVMAATHGLAPLPFDATEGRGDSLAQYGKRASEYLKAQTVEGGAASNKGGAGQGGAKPRIKKSTRDFLAAHGATDDTADAMAEAFDHDDDKLINYLAFAGECGRGADFARVLFRVVTDQGPAFIQSVGVLANMDKPTPKKAPRRVK